ncbi:MAG: MinD/ParA family protein [Gammaproteobacteria bacterium]|nr:MinD/ParA family protein [Gammaproteobacteria bacterium]
MTVPTEQPETARVVAITSGAESAGRSCISLNLGLALIQQGHKVCLLGADPEPSFSGPPPRLPTKHRFQDFLLETLDLSEVLIEGPLGMGYIPATECIADFMRLNGTQQTRLLSVLQEIENHFDYVLIDTTGGISESTNRLLLAAPFTIVTLTPEPTSLAGAFNRLNGVNRFYYDHPVFVIVNMSSHLQQDRSVYREFKRLAARYLQLEISYLGQIPRDEGLRASMAKKISILLKQPDSLVSHRLNSIASRLHHRAATTTENCKKFSEFFKKQKQNASWAEATTLTPSTTRPPLATESTEGAESIERNSPEDETTALSAASRFARLLGPMHE